MTAKLIKWWIIGQTVIGLAFGVYVAVVMPDVADELLTCVGELPEVMK
jgi:hypothetical protein